MNDLIFNGMSHYWAVQENIYTSADNLRRITQELLHMHQANHS